jgi:general secretion pathway protein E
MIDRILEHLPTDFEGTTFDRKKIWQSVGCEACNGIGYSGRMTISEVLPITKSMGELISRGALASEIEDAARAEGMITIAQDGILSVLEGKTTLDEIRRVTDE